MERTPAKWPAAIPVVLSMIYGAMPLDLIPDLIPLLGWSDDAAVMVAGAAIAIKVLVRRRQAVKSAMRPGTSGP